MTAKGVGSTEMDGCIRLGFTRFQARMVWDGLWPYQTFKASEVYLWFRGVIFELGTAAGRCKHNRNLATGLGAGRDHRNPA